MLLLIAAWISAKPSTVKVLFLEKMKYLEIMTMIDFINQAESFLSHQKASCLINPTIYSTSKLAKIQIRYTFRLKIAWEGNDKEHSFHIYVNIYWNENVIFI